MIALVVLLLVVASICWVAAIVFIWWMMVAPEPAPAPAAIGGEFGGTRVAPSYPPPPTYPPPKPTPPSPEKPEKPTPPEKPPEKPTTPPQKPQGPQGVLRMNTLQRANFYRQRENVSPVVWDDGLAAFAQSTIDKNPGKFVGSMDWHNVNVPGSEIIAHMLPGDDGICPVNCYRGIDAFYMTRNRPDNTTGIWKTGHYDALVDPTSKRIGCAGSNEKEALVCIMAG